MLGYPAIRRRSLSAQDTGNGRAVTVDAKLQELLQGVEPALNNKHYRTIQALLESYSYIAELVRDENMTMDRLRARLWGSRQRADESHHGQTETENVAQRRARRRRRAARSRKYRAPC
jgi:hypothetical protein